MNLQISILKIIMLVYNYYGDTVKKKKESLKRNLKTLYLITILTFLLSVGLLVMGLNDEIIYTTLGSILLGISFMCLLGAILKDAIFSMAGSIAFIGINGLLLFEMVGHKVNIITLICIINIAFSGLTLFMGIKVLNKEDK